jgi:hypothetical protein
VVALFEDTIDAEHALSALRKADHAPDRISLVVRDREADKDDATDSAGAVARAIVATALDQVGAWLRGLASLIVPERGTFLVAGPIGAALAGISTADEQGPGDRALSVTTANNLDTGGLLRTLADFGFNPDEATYLEHRLVAGAVLVAVTSGDESTLQATRRLFADHDAVHIGMAQTDARFLHAAETMLASPPETSSGGDVLVTDAVAPIRRLSVEGGLPEASALRRREVVDLAGNEVGEVDDVLVEAVDPDGPAGAEPERLVMRYLVVGHGGVLGLGRRRIAVPVAAAADLTSPVLRLAIPKSQFEHAPAYDEDVPFSRHDEHAIFVAFGLPPYWEAS